MSIAPASAAWWLRPLLRLLVVSVGLAAWFGTQALLGSRDAPHKDIEGLPVIGASTVGLMGAPFGQGPFLAVPALIPEKAEIGDAILDLLSEPNRYLREHRSAADALLIASTTIINLLGFFMLGMSILGPTVRPFLGLLLLFAMRQICQSLCALAAPPGMIWHDPGVPGLLVTYETATDFFFSGHTGLAVLGAVELVRFGGRRWLPLGVLIVIFEAAAVLVLRAHYTMDVFTGAVVALYVATLAERWAPWCDTRLALLWDRSMSEPEA